MDRLQDGGRDDLRNTFGQAQRDPGSAPPEMPEPPVQNIRKRRSYQTRKATAPRKAMRIPRVARLAFAGGATVFILAMTDIAGLLPDLGLDGAMLDTGSAAPLRTASASFEAKADDNAARLALAATEPASVATVLASTSTVWTGVFSQMGVAYQPPRFAPMTHLSGGPCAGLPSSHATYCAADGALYINSRATPDVAMAFTLAHEVGHHIQAMLSGLGPEPSFGEELQADCFAGVWARHGGGASRLLTPESLAETPEIADGGRVAAFARGYENGDAMVCHQMTAL